MIEAMAKSTGSRQRDKARQQALSAGVTLSPVEREQHDEVEESQPTSTPGIKAQRVVAPIDRLCRGRTLTDPQRQHAAAMHWLEDYEIGVLGVASTEEKLPVRVDVSTDSEKITQRQLDAARSYRDAQRKMGGYIGWVPWEVVIQGRTAREVGQRVGVDEKRIIGMLDPALLALADFYGY